MLKGIENLAPEGTNIRRTVIRALCHLGGDGGGGRRRRRRCSLRGPWVITDLRGVTSVV